MIRDVVWRVSWSMRWSIWFLRKVFLVRALFIVSALTWMQFVASEANADRWPNWRGPTSNGVAPAGDFPVNWSADSGIAWKVALPGTGASTPAVWENRIFVTCGIDGQNGLLCFDRHGQMQWKQTVGKLRPGKHKKATGCNSSPVTDGERVYVYYKSGDLACFDFAGKQLWHKNLQDEFGKDTLWWDLGTSTVLTERHLIVACMQSDNEHLENSYIAAFDRETGELDWRQNRNMRAPNEANQSYTTPQVVSVDGKETIVVLGADYLTAHSAVDGAEIWRVGSLNPEQNQYFRSIASPVISDGLVIAPYARGDSLTAVKLGGKGDITDSHVVWSLENPSSDVPTPIAADGRIVILTDKGTLAGLDVASGKTLWELKLEKSRDSFSASPVLAGHHVYATREDGTTFVVDITDEQPKVIAKNDLNEFTVATPVLADGQVLIRTKENLYCIGAPSSE